MPELGRGEQWGPLRPNRCTPRGTALMAAIIVAVLVWIAKSCLAVMYNTRSCAHEFIVSEDIQNHHRRHRARLPTHLMTREKTAMFSRPRERVESLILIEMHRRLRFKYVRCTTRIDGSHKIRIRGQSCTAVGGTKGLWGLAIMASVCLQSAYPKSTQPRERGIKISEVQ